MRVIRVLITLITFSASAYAEDRPVGIPNFHSEYPALTLEQYVLGPVCLSLAGSAQDLSCNPAFLANEDKHQVRLDLAFNDHLVQVNEYRERLAARDSIGIVDKVLSQKEPIVARATTACWYQRNWWAMGYVPFRGGFASLVRNPAYPEVNAHIYKENEIFAKAGMIADADKNLAAGLQLRFVDRQFFRRRFDLLDTISDPAQLKIESQRLILAEPGVSYSFDTAWSSSVSASLTQVPLVQDGYHTPFAPIFDVGFATAPPFAGRHLRTSTHYTGNQDQPDLLARFRWGATYDFDDVAAVFLSIGKTVAAIGVNGHYQSVTLGAGYKMEDVSPDQWQTTRISTLLFEAGLVF